jgi:hypothetical protein
MNRTTVVVGAGIMLCAVSLFFLQRRFDASDHAKGIRLLKNMTAKDRPETFEGFLARKHGGQPGTWDSEITGGCRGVVRVTWSLAGNPPTIYAWEVEIPSQAVHPSPMSPDGERLLAEFTEPNPLPPLELPPISDGGNK